MFDGFFNYCFRQVLSEGVLWTHLTGWECPFSYNFYCLVTFTFSSRTYLGYVTA